MSMRRTTTTRRAMAAVSMTAALAFALAGCGDDGGEKPGNEGSSAPSAPASPSAEDKGESQPDTAAGDNVDPDVKLAEIRGQNGVVMVINQVQRDSGGFVTVQAEVKNGGEKPANPAQWAGSESVIVRQNLSSVGGATLVDKLGKKRYYVLRDTDGRCLCTTKIAPLQPGDSTAVFMQFPAPPSTTTEVDFSVPTFATASLKISG
ncbi:hypothetical protein C6W96_23385 [Streptomyces sp. CS149]|uniref:hypothetical protein n=1 Tax=Streptomyces TaxID=1883 RepID=UPI000805DC12|nr:MULTISPECIES: hypothetical protein [unclassified Streptomyces]NUV66492.1 hypothetical protein [Streptomyces sp. CAI-121]NUV98558.1 hypothetical protein [Streptomyces sp. CAI 127]NUW11826.1 hypothetical protein [Streptomyces sp. CAI-68]PSK70324.1 hypothetical protein C6W96_23385 [Streptomyces sp. CS149]UCA53282.1 hypothetical protein LEL86_30145 [Streptomyces sp. WA6-1-16]